MSTAQGSTVSTTDAGITGIPGTSFFKPALHGQQNRSVLYYYDGIINTDFRGSIYGVLPIIDAVDEFKVQSHNEKAEFGGVLGGVVNLNSKSGTNQFHGSVWEFVRNNAFDARNPFNDFCNAGRCGPGTTPFTPAPPVHYNQNEFGAAGGGPIIRNKSFFFAGYEGWRYSKPPLTLALVPTERELSGDFSQSYYNQPIYNPLTTQCANGTCTREPFPGNVIPSNLISSTMQSYLRAYAAKPNLTGVVGANYIETRPQVDNANSWQIRVDHRFNDRDNVFGRLSQMWVLDTPPVAGTVAMGDQTYHAYNFGGGWNRVIKPNVILDLRAGAVLKPYRFISANAPNGFAPATQAGFKGLEQFGGMVTTLATPYTTTTGTAFNLGQLGESKRGNPGVNWSAGVTWIAGNHTIRAGYQYIYVNRFQSNLSQTYGFQDAQTSNIGAARTGNSLASALLGFPATYTGQQPDYGEVFLKFSTHAAYVQDEWKLRPNLTLTWGLRYDYLPKIDLLNKRLSSALDLFHQQYLVGAKSVPACSSTQVINPCIPGGIESVPFRQNIVFTDERVVAPKGVSDNIGPRLGLAWQFREGWVLRAGYSLLYDTVSARSQYAQNTIEGSVWPWSTGIGNQQANVAASGIWPGAPSNPLTPITSLVGAFPNPIVAASPWVNAGGGFTNDPDFKNARSQQWNVEIQKQISPNSVLSAAYVGSKNTRLDYSGYANAARQASPQGTAASAIDALKAIPWLVPTGRYSQSIGYSNYNGLEVRYQQRISRGLNTLASYTWSKTLDTSSGWFNVENGPGGGSVVQNYFNIRQNYGLAGYDVPHLFTWSTMYDFPFGRGQRWLKSGVASWILGNWATNYVFLARSGQPYNLVVNGDIANISGNGGTLSGYGRPNLVGDPKAPCVVNGVSIPSGTADCFFNPAAFATPSFSFGNLGRHVLRQEPFYNFDVSLTKNIPFGEQRSIQLRFEAFNALNFQILGTPGTTIGVASAGKVTSISSTPRQLQLGAKINF